MHRKEKLKIEVDAGSELINECCWRFKEALTPEQKSHLPDIIWKNMKPAMSAAVAHALTELTGRGIVYVEGTPFPAPMSAQGVLSGAPCSKCGYNGPGYYQPETHPCAAAQPTAEPELADERPAPPERQQEWLDWAVTRWHESVAQRPLVNVHRRTLDDVWREVIRFAGGDDESLCGPRHDVMRAEQQAILAAKGGE